jgi:hypothetical protein
MYISKLVACHLIDGPDNWHTKSFESRTGTSVSILFRVKVRLID